MTIKLPSKAIHIFTSTCLVLVSDVSVGSAPWIFHDTDWGYCFLNKTSINIIMWCNLQCFVFWSYVMNTSDVCLWLYNEQTCCAITFPASVHCSSHTSIIKWSISYNTYKTFFVTQAPPCMAKIPVFLKKFFYRCSAATKRYKYIIIRKL